MTGFFVDLAEQVQDYLPGSIAGACESPVVNGLADEQRPRFRAQEQRDQDLLDRIWQQLEQAHEEQLHG